MPITQAQIQAAQSVQHAAAHDAAAQVRVVAGPGTGKSFTIEERVRWLLSQGVTADEICAVSFTRASSLDLRGRIQAYCLRNGESAGERVRVSTLHSLALRTLRAAGLLTAYPADPLVLDSWEQGAIFDSEFGDMHSVGKKRSEEIRREHEAFWSTGHWGPPNYVPPTPAISPGERSRFQQFYGTRTQTYSCVLPGELTRQCVVHMKAGTLDPATLLSIRHLIVDEYQDLNPIDLEFVDLMAAQGVALFVAGDDDQSIYSFRYASPAGIQNFPTRYPSAGQHTLSDCFRCMPAVLDTGLAVIGANPGPTRIPKNYTSLYASAAPPQQGVVHRWGFASGLAEAGAVAGSCGDLIKAGINPRDILILLSNTRVLGPVLMDELQKADVPFEPPRADIFLDSHAGRLVLAVVRIVCDRDDYVAHRAILGVLRGVGVGTCNAIARAVVASNLNFRDIFYQELPAGVFTGRPLTALGGARALVGKFSSWQADDTLAQRTSDIAGIVMEVLGGQEAQVWQTFVAKLPSGATLEELRDFLWADTDEQQNALLEAICERLNQTIPAGGLLPDRVRLLTMHGAKGLSAKVVFVPGLEEQILPGPWRQPYPGLVLEAARLLYVSITRARAACIISCAGTRVVNGQFGQRAPSRFCGQLGGTFGARTSGLSAQEVQDIAQKCAEL